MNANDFFQHIKDNGIMAALASFINLFIRITPLKQFTTWKAFFYKSGEEVLIFMTCLLCGVFLSWTARNFGLAAYTDVVAGFGALGGERLIIIIRGKFLTAAKNFKLKDSE